MAKSNPPTRVCIDSSVLIAYLSGDQPKHADGISALFHDGAIGKAKIFGSTLLFPEVLGGGFDAPPDLAMENQIFQVLRNPNTLTLIQASVQVGMIARELRRELHLKTPDAVHLASAIAVDADYFMTVDEDDFPIGESVKGVQIEFPHPPSGAFTLPEA